MPLVRGEGVALLCRVVAWCGVGWLWYMRETVWILPGVRVRIEKTTSLYERTGSIQPLVDWLFSHGHCQEATLRQENR